MPTYVNLAPGDPAPWFKQRSMGNPRYNFDTAAGRYVVLCFFAVVGDEHAKAALEFVRQRRGFFNDVTASFFGVSLSPEDVAEKRIAEQYPGYRYFLDFDGTASRLYGAAPREIVQGQAQVAVRRLWVVLDPALRVMKVIPFAPDRSDIAQMAALIDGLPPVGRYLGFEMQAPVIVLPNVFEPDFCARLIGLYDSHGGAESGFMSEVDGKTVGIYDHSYKSRRDYVVEDPAVLKDIQAKVYRRIKPMVHRAHQFNATRMERYIVCCYAADEGGHFSAHRDNTTKGTAHRRFAVSINLNADFDGGEVSFPEFGPRSYKPPVGGAVVFSCSLLHAVSKVTRGRRYAFLPFLYDDEAARLREANTRFVEPDKAGYKSGLT